MRVASEVGTSLWTTLSAEFVHARHELEALLVAVRREGGRWDELMLTRQAALEERARRAGWCIGVLGAARGVDLLHARHEAEGLRWLVPVAAEARAWRLFPDAERLPLLAAGSVGWKVALLAAWAMLRARAVDGVVRWSAGSDVSAGGDLREHWLAFDTCAEDTGLAARCDELAPALPSGLRLEPTRGRLELGWS